MSLERIEITPFAVIAGDILQNRQTGYLTILKPPLQKVLYWSQGELVMAASSAPEDSLGEFLVRRGAVSADKATELFGDDPNAAVERVHELGVLDHSARQTLLREWLTAQFVPLFSLDEGTAVFTLDEALAPERRIFLQSTASLLIEGVRSITNGLVLRRSLGDLKREIEPARNSRFSLESLPLTEQERGIAAALREPMSIETFLKRFPAQSGAAAKVVVAMLALGVYSIVRQREKQTAPDLADMERDLELLAAIGASDQRSLRAIALSRQLPSLDHYQVLDVPRAASRSQISAAGEAMHARYAIHTFPPAARDSVMDIIRRIDEALEVLRDQTRRAAYDKLLQARGGEGAASIQQRLTQRSIADQNFNRAKQLVTDGDYYGAILLLKQTVQFVPDHAAAWQLLASCQERNPRWRREAVESYQMTLSIEPENIDAMLSLGDLYRLEGMMNRAQTCYEDVLKITPDNQQAKRNLQQLKKR